MSGRAIFILLAAAIGLLVTPALGQVMGPPAPGESTPLPNLPDSPQASGPNPLSILQGAAELLQGEPQAPGNPGESTVLPTRGLSSALSIMMVLTVITLVPSIMLMTTCFVRILVVLGLLKQAMGTQTLPPAQVTTGLALFMTLLVMSPTIDRIWSEAIEPHQRGEVESYDELWDRAKQPVRDFMFDQIEATGNWSSVYMVLNYRGIDTSEPQSLTRADVDMVTLVPAFMLSELKVAFVMGFKVYLPFLVIDMVIASLLISMSMMMLPPVLISLPFKLLLFVLVDGWTLVVGSLMTSFVQSAPPAGVGEISMVLPSVQGVLESAGSGVRALGAAAWG
ncbi:MAG: flagellar type III secretion system pore protein FliP [Phycisphaerales bacterium JB037]